MSTASHYKFHCAGQADIINKTLPQAQPSWGQGCQLAPISNWILSPYIQLLHPIGECCLSTSSDRTNTDIHEIIQINVGFFLSCLTYRTSITHIWNGFCCAKFGDKIVNLLLSSTKKKSTRLKCISIKWLERINYTSVGGRRSTYHNMALKM